MPLTTTSATTSVTTSATGGSSGIGVRFRREDMIELQEVLTNEARRHNFSYGANFDARITRPDTQAKKKKKKDKVEVCDLSKIVKMDMEDTGEEEKPKIRKRDDKRIENFYPF